MPDIHKTVILEAPTEKVWKAVSTSEGLEGWWMPNTLEAVEGRDFILHAGQFGDSPCRITRVVEKSRIEFDWDKDWHLAFELKYIGKNRTELTLTHSGWQKTGLTKFGQPHTDIRKVMDAGWENGVNTKLPQYLKDRPN